MHLDEADEKDSNRAIDAKNNDLSYPEIKMDKMYESKDGRVNRKNSQKPPFGSQK